VKNNIPLLNVYKKKSKDSEVVTQLLYGENFKKINKNNSWIKIKIDTDKYKGYIVDRQFPKNIGSTHKVYNLSSNLYSKPNNKYKVKKKLTFGSKIKVLEKKGNFYRFDNLWIKKNNLKKNSFRMKNYFYYVKKFINVKYKWGGKSFNGIDCSALVQLLLNFNNIFCPRDSGQQINFFKQKVELKNIKKNDLIFWKGHVAIALSKTKLIHAYGPMKKVAVSSINKTINRIYKTANLKVIGIKRMN
jgi:hypothetical protein